jgi:methionine-rich copper-binding protein CopC
MLGVAASAATIATLALIGGASAHAPFDSSTPAPSQQLTSAPTSVVINFQENIQKTFGSYGMTVARDGGVQLAIGGPTASSDTQLTATLPSNLGDGRYVVNWNNTAADDGDQLSGAFAFYVNTTPTAANLTADQQLAAVEGDQLATATAEANSQATQTAAAGAAAPIATAPAATLAASAPTVPAPVSTAVAPPATSGRLPATGTGPDGSSASVMLLATLAVSVAAVGLAVVAFGKYRTH